LLPTTQRGGKYQKRGVLYVAHGLWATRKARADLRLRMHSRDRVHRLDYGGVWPIVQDHSVSSPNYDSILFMQSSAVTNHTMT
jgi:hypothetical protein